MNAEILMLNQKVNQVKLRVETVMTEQLGPNRNLDRLGVRDRQRLTNLLIWEERYYVSLEELVGFLLEHYRGFVKPRKNQRGLGIRVNTLMSPRSEQLVRDWLDEKYPNQEHIKLWKQREQSRIVRNRLKAGDLELVDHYQPKKYNNLDEYVKDYREQTRRIRRMWDRLLDPQLKRKNYRGSPWR